MTAKKKTTAAKRATNKGKAVQESVTSYKGFDANFKCRDFQYEVGATYETKEVKVCAAGFHACANPLDVLNYYPLLNDDAKPNRFAVVEQGGQLERHEQDSKVASAKITITAELNIGEFIKRAVSWVVDACKTADTVSGDDCSQIAASGNSAKLAASGNSAQIAASGHYARLAASGNSAQIAASGNSALLAASGDYALLAASGYAAKLAASGNSAKLAASGNYAQIAASGHYAKLAASGNYAQIAASGDSAQIAASGNSAQIAASGDSALLAASGNSAKLAASGKDSVIASSAFAAKAKGAAGTWIALAEFDKHSKCIGFATGCAGVDGVPADTWLVARDGKLVTP